MLRHPPHHLGVCLLHAAQVLAKTVFVQLFLGAAVPETAGVWANLIRQDDGAVPQAAKLQLEIYQSDPTARPECPQQLVYPEGEARAWLVFSRGSPRASFL